MKIIVPATSANLGPGFDSLGLAIKFYNEVRVDFNSFKRISISGEGSNIAKIKANNYFVSIFEENFKLLSNFNFTSEFSYAFNNNIPFSRGLGSSSAVIVSAIAGSYAMLSLPIKKDVILNKALEYENHPDNISPAVFGGFTSNIVNDKKVLTQKFKISNDIKAVIVIPNQPMSTNSSRMALPKNITLANAVNNISCASYITACFAKQDYESLKFAARDSIHEYVRMLQLPELFDIRKIAYSNGSLFSTLSGSGSSFLNISFADSANRLSQSLKSSFPKFRVEIFDFDNDGFKVIES